MVHTPTFLTPSQINSFFQDGAIHLPAVLQPSFAEQCAREMLGYMNIDEHDPSTWHALRAKPGNRGEPPPGQTEKTYLYSQYAPRLWAAMCDLLGGAHRIIPDKKFRSNGVYNLADPSILSLPDPASAWQPPTPTRGGWHVDGAPSWFTHYLDSPQVSLLVLILFRDATKLGGATWYAPQSPRLMSRFYAENPQGGLPEGRHIMSQCTDLRYAEGNAGDAFLLHPFMMHTGSTNVLPQPRLMENDNISLREKLQFNRPDPTEFSLLEKSILNHLGVERLDFVRTT